MNRSIPNSQGLNLPTDIHPHRSPIVPIIRSERYAPSNHGWRLPPSSNSKGAHLSILFRPRLSVLYDEPLHWQ